MDDQQLHVATLKQVGLEIIITFVAQALILEYMTTYDQGLTRSLIMIV